MAGPDFVPQQYKTINSFIIVKNAKEAIGFYNRAFGADEVTRLTDPNGVVVHAEMRIEDTIFMVVEENDVHGLSPLALGGVSSFLQIYTGDVEAMTEEAVKAGAKLLSPITLQFSGARTCKIKDPYGHHWILSTQVENLTEAQLQKRFHALFP